MKISVNLPHTGPLATPSAVKEVAQTAEALNFSGLLFVDHLALPRQVDSLYDLGPQPVGIPEHNMRRTLSPLYECVATMAYVAGLTTRVRLRTGILVLPLRNPVYNARQIATIDAMSGGRVDLGIGVGWLKEEADQLQMPWDKRGARTDEHVAVMRTLWECDDDYVSFNGKFYRFEEIDPEPHPVQRPLPILIGGHTDAAKRRAGRIGNGWITARLDPESQKRGMDEVRQAAIEAGRDPEALYWSNSIDARYEHGQVKKPESFFEYLTALAETGVHEVAINAMARSQADFMALLNWLGSEVVARYAE